MGEEHSFLSELIFGSTAMRFHGNYYKIHNLTSPQKILLTQIFPTPLRKKLSKMNSAIKTNKSSYGSYNSEQEDPLFEKRGSTNSDSSISRK